uniref:Uncharacterized protein n=1 Tax=Lepeophtheirus salmonis TaxID=72036 RepID=A0A0K2TSI3_LEPSM
MEGSCHDNFVRRIWNSLKDFSMDTLIRFIHYLFYNITFSRRIPLFHQ